MTLHVCNPFFERELSGHSASTLEEASLQHPIFAQLQFLPLLYANEGDGLIVSAKPEVCNAPLYFPDEPLPKHAKIVDWGASLLIAEWAKKRGLEYEIPDWNVVQSISSKLFSFERSPLPGSARIGSRAELDRYLKETAGPVVLKDCFESSGRGHFFLFPNQPIDEGSLAAFFSKGHPLIAEPWVTRTCDFSTQWEITKAGEIHYLGLTICHNDALGKYRASEIGDPNFSIDFKIYQNVLGEISSLGFFGNLGIDGMFYKRGHETVLQPIVEINPRKTMGYVALAFQQKQFSNQHLSLFFSNGEKESLIPQTVITRKGARLKFRKTLWYQLWNSKN